VSERNEEAIFKRLVQRLRRKAAGEALTVK
jgi:hypothetical protein